MLHLRSVVLADLTDGVVAVLTDDPAVTSITVLRGASVKPPGDVVEADVAREAANDVLERLVGLGVHHEGSVTVEPVPTWVSRAAYEAQEVAPGSGADSVVWAEVTQRSYEDSELTWTYLSFLVLATLLAGIAIITDSQILVIGAMVLGPEFGAIAALGLALVRRRPRLLGMAARTLVVGFVIAIAATCLLALVGRALGWVTLEQIAGHRPGTEFIYEPTRWSFVVAVIAAAAGVLSLTSSRVGGLSGVFISVTTVPAAGNVGLGLAFAEWGEVRGSALQLVINIAGMAVAGWLTLLVQRTVWSRVSAYRARLVSRRRPVAP